MKSVHIRDLPAQTLERLKRRAKLHHRSLQGELHAILEWAAELPVPEEESAFRLLTVAVGGEGWSREEIYGDEAG